MTVDLFTPPERVEYRQQALELRKGGTERAAAECLGITVTAAQRAAGLDRLMQQLNLADPYVPLREPPMDYPKMRRHRHPRYRFDPLPGYPINRGPATCPRARTNNSPRRSRCFRAKSRNGHTARTQRCTGPTSASGRDEAPEDPPNYSLGS